MIVTAKSDIAKFLKPLAGEIQGPLLNSSYEPIAELWESYDKAMLELYEIGPVLDLMRCHDKTWHGDAMVWWLQGLMAEVGELAASLQGRHEHPWEWEVMQIATIALNWLRLFSTNARLADVLRERFQE